MRLFFLIVLLLDVRLHGLGLLDLVARNLLDGDVIAIFCRVRFWKASLVAAVLLLVRSGTPTSALKNVLLVEDEEDHLIRSISFTIRKS